ncbi:MAG: flagellar hook-associated protein FlgK, partial [Sulfurimicrobium sp.]|nr:flagellar hook-associated protein FlgK [Sulfurimicrobium sp.]
MSGALDVGISGLRAAQIGLTTTGHNITNAATPGYHRQEIVQSASTPVNTGAGFLGTGVSVNAVKRVYSDFLELQVQTAQTQSSYLETYSAQISQFNNMVADPSAGLSPALQQFFQGVHDVAANPASVPSRQSMISSADALVTRFQTLNQRFDEIREGINSQVTASVSMINSYARQIAELNSRVVIAQASSNGQPNDLLDLRDNLISELNKEINVSVVKQSDGA